MNFLDSSAKCYGDDHVVPVCPSVTRWTAHERACHTFHTNYRHFLKANIATILMLLEVFHCIKPLSRSKNHKARFV